MDEFKYVFEKVELDCPNISTLIELLPLLVNEDSTPDVNAERHSFWEGTVCFK